MGKGTFLCAFLSSRVDEEKGATKDEMAGWHDQLNEHEFEKALGDGEGQGSLACCSPRGCKKSDITERLNERQQWLITG